MSGPGPRRDRTAGGESPHAHLLLAAARGAMAAFQPDLDAGSLSPAKHTSLLLLQTALERFPLAAPDDQQAAA